MHLFFSPRFLPTQDCEGSLAETSAVAMRRNRFRNSIRLSRFIHREVSGRAWKLQPIVHDRGLLGALLWWSCSTTAEVPDVPLVGQAVLPPGGSPAHGVAVLRLRRARRHGERSRSQLLFQLGGAENMLILAVNGLAVKFWLSTVPSPSIY